LIQLLTGAKGSGKTKKLIEMANEAVQTTDGHIVFIDDDKRHIFDLKHSIRFVDTADFPLSNYREFIGFVCGILSQNNDIVEIFVDGLTNVVKNIGSEDLVKLKLKLDSLSEAHGVNFIIGINSLPDELPDELKELVIA